jgi:1-aminocyclopropane-1-carboxylate deaminase
MHKLTSWHKIFNVNSTPVDRLDSYKRVKISIKRDDLNHEIIQGNKLRKLKYNIKYAIDQGFDTVATFGGAWSNHIVATAQAAQLSGLSSIGFIRGDELRSKPNLWSNSLNQAHQYGMKFVFVNRKEYREKHNSQTVKKHLAKQNQQPYLIPEGGSNKLALKGVAELIKELSQQIKPITHIITACGTGGTMAGLIEGVSQLMWNSKIIGIPVLKGAQFLEKDINTLITTERKVSWQLYHDYHAGGYAKIDAATSEFAKKFTDDTKIQLDKIYTAKSFYAAYDLIEKNIIKPNSSIVILHTGGLQGGIIK